MKQAVKLGQNLVLNADSSAPEVSSLRQEVKEIPDRFDELKNQLTEQQVQLERIIQDSAVFHRDIRELELWVTEVSESTAMQDPISTNPKVVHKRLELTEVSEKWPSGQYEPNFRCNDFELFCVFVILCHTNVATAG